MRKPLVLLTLVLALVLLTSACGDDASVGGPSTEAPTPTSLPGDTPADETPADETPVDETPIDETPVDETPIDGGGEDPVGPILGAGPFPIADLTIAVKLDPDGSAVIYRLACLGDTATLTGDPAPSAADEMCLALLEPSIRDRLVSGEPEGQMCTEQYGGPEVATISGTLDGEDVATDFHRANGCGIGDWQLLVVLLPAV